MGTGAAYGTLPAVWRERLGQLTHLDTVSKRPPQAVVSGDIRKPGLLRMGDFRPVLEWLLVVRGGSDGAAALQWFRLSDVQAGVGSEGPLGCSLAEAVEAAGVLGRLRPGWWR